MHILFLITYPELKRERSPLIIANFLNTMDIVSTMSRKTEKKKGKRNSKSSKRSKKNKELNDKATKTKDNEEKKAILAVCAHSDDQIIGAGGALAKFADEGYDVKIIILSKGELSHPLQKENYTVKTRIKESEEAAKIIKAKEVIFFDLNEGNFLEEYRKKGVFQKLREIMDKERPAKIFTHSYDDIHKDHRNTFTMTMEAIESIEGYNPEVLTFDIWNLIESKKTKHPAYYIDVTKYVGTKIKALQCFKSQKISMISLFFRIYVGMFLNGIRIGRPFAEKFYKVK
ncbi:MAG: hypothetical protein PWR30_150 [Candidatus Woesearchaeota archaeon]|nr:hypothetical protein [Candidatus Woesearchaeota archaeon]